MLIEAATVFLALIGTTLSCMNTGARVTYAMGKDEEVPTQFGMLHGKTLSPHRAIWFLVVMSTIVGILTTVIYLGGQSADMAAIDKTNLMVQDRYFLTARLYLAAELHSRYNSDQQPWHVSASQVLLHDHVHRGHRGLP